MDRFWSDPGEAKKLGHHAFTDILTIGLALLTFDLLEPFKWNSVWLILAGAVIEVLRFWLLIS